MLGITEFAVTLLVLVAAILYYWSGRRERQMMAKIPGPPGHPIIGVLLSLLLPLEELVNLCLAWSIEYGPIFLIRAPAIQEVIVSGPDSIQVVLNSNTNISKNKAYRFLWSWIGTGILTSAGSKWRARRKMLNPAFHIKILESFVPVFNANSAILVAKLGEHMADEYVEIDDYVSLCALDIICETAMGTSINAQKGGEVEYIRAVKRMCELFFHRTVSPWLYNDLLYRLSPSGREEKRSIRVLKHFTSNVIQRKRLENLNTQTEIRREDEECKKRLSLLDLLLEMSDQQGKLTDEDIREEIDTVMFAGHDTTAAAICWALFLLGAHQDIQDKAAAELADIFGSDRRQPTTADLQNMTYMDMVIKESLRLYPSVATFGRCIESDLQIGEYTIPCGYNVSISAYNVHRNPDIYPDPDKFDPERFSPEQSSGRHPYAYIPFSGGLRNCIGQKFARLEEKCVLASILRHYKLESIDYENVKVMPFIVLKSKEPLKIKISARVV